MSRNEKEDGTDTDKPGKYSLMTVECEICGSWGFALGAWAGAYICARCHRDIVDPRFHD